MFTTIKRALTALTITASLLTPISANAGELSRDESDIVLGKGKILSVVAARFVSDFVIEYRGRIFVCVVMQRATGTDIDAQCYD